MVLAIVDPLRALPIVVAHPFTAPPLMVTLLFSTPAAMVAYILLPLDRALVAVALCVGGARTARGRHKRRECDDEELHSG